MGGSGTGTPDFGRRSGGGGGGGGTGGSSGPGGGGDPCSAYVERALLASPRPDVLKALKKGSHLDVRLTKGKPPILAVAEDGKTAGTLVPPSLVELTDCLKAGHKFVATVVKLKGGMCEVDIRAVESQ